jgi:signal transduction histidine kinase
MRLVKRVIHSYLEADANGEFDGQIAVGFKGATLDDVARLWEIVATFLKELKRASQADQDS